MIQQNESYEFQPLGGKAACSVSLSAAFADGILNSKTSPNYLFHHSKNFNSLIKNNKQILSLISHFLRIQECLASNCNVSGNKKKRYL